MFPATPPGVNQPGRARLTLGRGLPALRAALHAALLPPRCLLCCGAGQTGLPPLAGPVLLELCAPCQADLPRAPASQPVGAGFELACCPWAYRWPVDQLVRALKFGGERSHARLLGALLACERLALGPPWPQLIVPVPLHPLRLRERGYNQAAELARFAGAAIRLPVFAHALERLRATRPQSGLGASGRSANVAGAFRARALPRGPGAPGLRVALVDDVVTTGSTAAAAARALRDAGAGSVELWAVAHALRRRDASDERDAPDAPGAPDAVQWPDV